MNHQSLVQAASIAPPKELAFMFADPPLVGDEKREDFDKLLIAIAGAVNPADEIVWLSVLGIANLSWEIRREVPASICQPTASRKSIKQFERPDADGPYRCEFHGVFWWLHRVRCPWLELWRETM
jgi:hypothetical protein